MPRTYHLHREQIIPRPVEEVFPFFADAGNLEAITPPFLNFHIVTPRPIEMKTGALIDYRLRMFGVPLFWRTRIESFEPPHRFTDVQLRGPYRQWHHTHLFEAVPEGTRMIDHVEYQIPFGPLGSLAQAAFVRRTLGQIFDFRRDTVAQLLSLV